MREFSRAESIALLRRLAPDLTAPEGDRWPRRSGICRWRSSGEGEPWPFYQQFGFQPTGEIDEGEIMLRLSFSAR